MIPLKEALHAYAQCIGFGKYGQLIQVYETVTKDEFPLDEVVNMKPMFPPVYTWLSVPINAGRWKRLGRRQVRPFAKPLFRYSSGTKPGVYKDWRIWDGEKFDFVGELKREHRRLEMLCSWGAEILEGRILSGHNMFENVL